MDTEQHDRIGREELLDSLARSLTRVIRLLSMSFQLRRIEVHFAQIARRVPLRFVIEVL